MSTDIARYTPQTQPNWRDEPHVQEGLTKVYELLKGKYPKKYAELQRQRIAAMVSQPRIDAMLNDPTMQVEYETLRINMQRREYSHEFALLSIEPNATKREVYNAYRRKARKMHPDAGGSDEAFKQLQDAYHKLLKLAPKDN